MDCPGGGHRRLVRLADPGWSGPVQPVHCAAPALPSPGGFSCGVGHSVRLNGRQRSQNFSGPLFPGQVPGPVDLFSPAVLQFSVEHSLFQPAGLRLCPDLAHCSLGADRFDDRLLQQNRSSGRPAADPLSALGKFCSLSESRCLAAQPLKTQQKRPETKVSGLFCGGAKRDRTAELLNCLHVLSRQKCGAQPRGRVEGFSTQNGQMHNKKA